MSSNYEPNSFGARVKSYRQRREAAENDPRRKRAEGQDRGLRAGAGMVSGIPYVGPMLANPMMAYSDYLMEPYAKEDEEAAEKWNQILELVAMRRR